MNLQPDVDILLSTTFRKESAFPPYIILKDSRVYINIIVKPNSRKSEIVGIHDNRLKIAIKAQPQEGKANKELLKFLSKFFDLPISYFEITLGVSCKEKRVALLSICSLNQVYSMQERVANHLEKE